jgi:hypothetical protein
LIEPLTHLDGDVMRHARVDRPPHQLQRISDPFVGRELEIRRLREVHGHRLPQRVVEITVGGAVRDMTDQDGAAFDVTIGPEPPPARTSRQREKHDDSCGGNRHDARTRGSQVEPAARFQSAARPAQILAQVRRGLIAPIRIFLERAEDDSLH